MRKTNKALRLENKSGQLAIKQNFIVYIYCFKAGVPVSSARKRIVTASASPASNRITTSEESGKNKDILNHEGHDLGLRRAFREALRQELSVGAKRFSTYHTKLVSHSKTSITTIINANNGLKLSKFYSNYITRNETTRLKTRRAYNLNQCKTKSRRQKLLLLIKMLLNQPNN